MIAYHDLENLVQARLEDAQALFQATRYDCALYVCGYAVEIALKARISKTLGWNGFPDSRKDFEKLQTFKTHELNVLLRLSGIEDVINREPRLSALWYTVSLWSPELRYQRVGTFTRIAAEQMLKAAANLKDIFL